MKNSSGFFWLLSTDVSRTVLPSTAEGKKVARFISLACFEGGTVDQPGERGRVQIYQGASCCSCISFSTEGNEKVHCARGVAETGSALLISHMGQLHQWWYKSFALLWMMHAGGGLLFLSSLHHWEEMRSPTWATMYWTVLFTKCKSPGLHSPCGAPVFHISWESGPKHLLHLC